MGKYTVHRKDGNHDEIREGLEAVGASVIPDGPGDFLVGYHGATFILEAKTAKGKLRASQERFRAGWRGHYAVVRTVDEALREIRAVNDRCEWPGCVRPALCRSGNFGGRLVCSPHFRITNGAVGRDGEPGT